MQNFISAVVQQVTNCLQNFFNLIKSNWKTVVLIKILKALITIVFESLIERLFS